MSERTEKFARNTALEALLGSLNSRLEPAGDAISSGFSRPEFPVCLIVGSARSGTTLFLQWLARTGLFCYPSNFISRFFVAPCIGLQIQKMLLDDRLAFGQELGGARLEAFGSNLGKTTGWLEPNEFWYFWRRFFTDSTDQSSVEFTNRKRLIADLAALESEARQPLAMKAMIANWWIEELDRLLNKVVFVHLRRDVRYTAQSLLEARKTHSGSVSNWYSFKTPGFGRLKKLDPISQVVGQVLETQRAVDESLNKLNPDRYLVLEYEDFCVRPEDAYIQLKSRYEAQGHTGFPATCPILGPFKVENECRMEGEDWQNLTSLIEQSIKG